MYRYLKEHSGHSRSRGGVTPECKPEALDCVVHVHFVDAISELAHLGDALPKERGAMLVLPLVVEPFQDLQLGPMAC